MKNYTRQFIKIATILTISLNLSANTPSDPKECYIYHKGELSFLHILANQSMYVKTGEDIERLLSQLKMSGSNSRTFIRGRKDIVSKLLDIRYHRSSPIPKSKLINIIEDVKRDQKACIKRPKAKKSFFGEW